MKRKDRKMEKFGSLAVIIIIITFVVTTFVTIITSIIHYESNRQNVAEHIHHSSEVIKYGVDDDGVTRIKLDDGTVFKSYKKGIRHITNFESNIVIDDDNIQKGYVITYIKHNDNYKKTQKPDDFYTIMDVEKRGY